MFTRLFLASTLTISASVAVADICTEVRNLVHASQDGFADVPPPLTGAKSCQMTLGLGGVKAYHCAWEFDYRAPAAQSTFAAFDTDLATCFAASSQHDQGVNHPDFYDLREYAVKDAVVRVSLKDKGALGQTYVFVAVESAG
jgi:hypothetical protein